MLAGTGITTIAFVDGVDVAAVRASRTAGAPAAVAPLRIEYAPDDFVVVESLGDVNRLRIRIGDADLLSGSELMQLTASAGGALPGSLAPSAVAQGKLADNLYEIGTIGLTPMIQGVVVISTRLHNVPKTLGNDWPLRSPGNARPEQFFFTR